MTACGKVKIVQGSVEYLYADIRADRVLDTQAVSIAVQPYANSADPLSWIVAEWVGNPGTFRSARILLDGTLAEGRYRVYARFVDSAETPIIYVGVLEIV